MKLWGIPDESCFPYHPWDMSCLDTCSDWKERAVKISGWYSPGDDYSMKSALSEYGPLVCFMHVYEDFCSYTGGIYEHVWGKEIGGHSVTIVGYNDDPGYWICKNSWGTNWGENGWFKIKYGECGMVGWSITGAKRGTVGIPQIKPAKVFIPTSENVISSYTYSPLITDSDEDKICRMLPWGNSITSGWLGQTVNPFNIWNAWGDYASMVKEKNERSLEGFRSDPLIVSIPTNKAIDTSFLRLLENHPHLFSLLQQLLGVQ